MTDATTTEPPGGSVAASGHRRPRTVPASDQRQAEQIRQLRALQLTALVVAVVLTLLQHPSAGLAGAGLGITVALSVYVAGSLVLCSPRSAEIGTVPLVAVLAGIAGAGIVLAGLQPRGAGDIPASIPVFVASIRLPPRVSRAVVAPVVVALAVTAARDLDDVVGSVLLCVVLAAVGRLFREIRTSRDRTEMLLDELEDARDEQARAAALDERARIARELHDVLAHSLSGLSIQLEGARKLAGRAPAAPELRAVIDRSATLAKEGLTEARKAVGALRQDDLLTVEQLPELVGHYRRDLGLPVDLETDGQPRRLPAEVSLTIYRVVGEALTNVMRHAPGAATHVRLSWAAEEVRLRVHDEGAGPGAAPADRGGGWGLIGMRERVARVDGVCVAGPDGVGWTVDAVVPG